MTTQFTRTRPAPRMTAYQRRLYDNDAPERLWRTPAEVGASTTATPKRLDEFVACPKCEMMMKLCEVAAHRRECFKMEML